MVTSMKYDARTNVAQYRFMNNDEHPDLEVTVTCLKDASKINRFLEKVYSSGKRDGIRQVISEINEIGGRL